jgi:hypothetical protein
MLDRCDAPLEDPAALYGDLLADAVRNGPRGAAQATLDALVAATTESPGRRAA